MQEQYIEKMLQGFSKAKQTRSSWESVWQECYDFTLPHYQYGTNKSKTAKDLYDATAMDAVDQLAASLLGNLTPPWNQWFGFKPGPNLSEEEAEKIAPLLETITAKIHAHLDQSNFSVELHQCFLDLIIGGTATLYVEETEPGALSAFKFTAVPLYDVYLEEGEHGFLDISYRHLELNARQIQNRYQLGSFPEDLKNEMNESSDKKYNILEAIYPKMNRYEFHAVLMDGSKPIVIKDGYFDVSPVIGFRWMKSPGEVYGRSPVMKALPDIKTANKVVELILKNASIAVTGIWQADDDGVLNPANIELLPGTIIPKAVGSQGLRALEMPGRFDVSELVLKDLRARIRQALLSDKLNGVVDQKMTATEVLERSSQIALLLGATYGRLQTELLTPLVKRLFYILKRRGDIPDIQLDGKTVALDYRSPLAKSQSQRGINNILMWLDSVSAMGADASLNINKQEVVKYLGDSLAVPKNLLSSQELPIDLISEIGEEQI
ncbi:MAG: portal protein [Pseudomonadota bacterium]